MQRGRIGLLIQYFRRGFLSTHIQCSYKCFLRLWRWPCWLSGLFSSPLLLLFLWQVEILRKRLHKDILHNPVVMLNLCPDLKSMTSEHMSPQGEFIFLLDRSGSMSGTNISHVKVSIHLFVCLCACFISILIAVLLW